MDLGPWRFIKSEATRLLKLPSLNIHGWINNCPKSISRERVITKSCIVNYLLSSLTSFFSPTTHFSIYHDLKPKKLIIAVYQGHFWCCQTIFSFGGPKGSYNLLRNLTSFWAIFFQPCVGDGQTNETINIYDTWNTHTSS